MIGMFVDGAFLDLRWKEISPGSFIDYQRFADTICRFQGDQIEEAYYYDANLRGDRAGKRDAILRAGFRVKDNYRISDRGLRTVDGDSVVVRMQKGVDVALAVGVLRSHSRRRWNRIVLVAGDADFAEILETLVEDHDVEVTVVASRGHISSELAVWKQSILYIEDIADDIRLQEPVNAIRRSI